MIEALDPLRLRVTEQLCTYNAFRTRWPDGTIIQNEFKNECNCDFLNVPNFRIIQ